MDWNIILVDVGQAVVPWAVTFLVGLLSKYVYSKIQSDFWRSVATNATTEVFDAAQEVHQTYIKQIKKGREDGVLTDEERAKAKRMAVETAKSNLGAKGVARLGKIVGAQGVDNYLSTKVESAVSALKTTEKAVEKAVANP